ncbi:MAG: hypothetical protein GY744_08925 [Gammaproteobacteria bacterium]|nr:hypothetical protein [Gammaproteobacteria bacterium]
MNSILSVWFNSLKHYLQLSVFSSSPAKLPFSPASVILTLVAYITVGELLLGAERGLLSIIIQIGIEVLILFTITFIVLKITRKPERLLQTLSALIGVSLIISLVSLLIMSALPDSSNADEINPLIIQANIILLLWNLAAISLIFKRAFEIRTLTAGIIAFNYFLFYEYLLFNFF